MSSSLVAADGECRLPFAIFSTPRHRSPSLRGTVERYVSRYRAAYSLYAARLQSERSIGHRVQGDVYYGHSSSSVGLALSLGDEVESTLPNGVLRTSVRGAGVVGRQWLTPRWLLICDALVLQQGALYTRRRISIGLEHRF
jgi:YaiO family outer membrane protein